MYLGLVVCFVFFYSPNFAYISTLPIGIGLGQYCSVQSLINKLAYSELHVIPEHASVVVSHVFNSRVRL